MTDPLSSPSLPVMGEVVLPWSGCGGERGQVGGGRGAGGGGISSGQHVQQIPTHIPDWPHNVLDEPYQYSAKLNYNVSAI